MRLQVCYFASVLGAAVAGLALAAFAQPAGAHRDFQARHGQRRDQRDPAQGQDRRRRHLSSSRSTSPNLPKKPTVVVYLNSTGGNLREGMRLGRFFFHNKIETVVESKTACASACALAFLGGRDGVTGKPHRTKASTSGVGFHSFSREFDKDKNYCCRRPEDRRAA